MLLSVVKHMELILFLVTLEALVVVVLLMGQV